MLNFYYKSGIGFLTGAPLACRTSPACSTPSTRWWMPPSTILPAAARRCESSCPWLPTAASGGGAVRRVRQVKPPVHTVGDSSAEKRAFCVCPPRLLCRLPAHTLAFVVMQKRRPLQAVKALFLSVSASLHLSYSIGFIFNDLGGWGRGVTEPREPPPNPWHLQIL